MARERKIDQPEPRAVAIGHIASGPRAQHESHSSTRGVTGAAPVFGRAYVEQEGGVE